MFFSIVCISLVTVGIVMWFSAPTHLVSYLVGVIIGSLLVLLSIRRIGKKCQKSHVWSQIFHKLTQYRTMVFNIPKESQNISIKIISSGDNSTDMINALSQLNFPKNIAQEATHYANEHFPDQSIEQKLRQALIWIDTNQIKA